MKKIFLTLLIVSMLLCGALGISSVAFAEGEPTPVGTAEELLAMSPNGNYVLTADITLPEGKYVNSFYGTLDGDRHTVTIDNSVGLFNYLGKVVTDKNGKVTELVNGTVKFERMGKDRKKVSVYEN